jgi:hypothetical protein
MSLLSAFIHPVNLTDVIPVRFHHRPQLSGAHMLLGREKGKKKINSAVSVSIWDCPATLHVCMELAISLITSLKQTHSQHWAYHHQYIFPNVFTPRFFFFLLISL